MSDWEMESKTEILSTSLRDMQLQSRLFQVFSSRWFER